MMENKYHVDMSYDKFTNNYTMQKSEAQTKQTLSFCTSGACRHRHAFMEYKYITMWVDRDTFDRTSSSACTTIP